jgi:hypothetical protein
MLKSSRHRCQGIHSAILICTISSQLLSVLYVIICTLNDNFGLNINYGYYGYPDGYNIASDLLMILSIKYQKCNPSWLVKIGSAHSLGVLFGCSKVGDDL